MPHSASEDAVAAELLTTSSIIQVSDSPVKANPDIWIADLDLYECDKAILESTTWLNDNIIRVTQDILLKKGMGKILGGESTVCQTKGWIQAFATELHIHTDTEYRNYHWILVSNIDPRDGSSLIDSVGIQDSNRMTHVSQRLMKEICSFVRPTSDTYTFDIINIMNQPNGSDCGLFAIACATELVERKDPALCHWDCTMMRPHLMQC